MGTITPHGGGSGTVLAVHGMAVHVVPPGDARGRAAGVGVQFYAVDRDTLATWSSVVREIAARRAAPAPDERRTVPRYAAQLDLELRSVDELRTLCTRDVSEGGMFIVTDLSLPVGEMLQVHVIHPSAGTAFPLDARVCRHEKHPVQGLGIAFLAMTPARREAFMEFVHGSIVLDDVWQAVDIPFELSA